MSLLPQSEPLAGNQPASSLRIDALSAIALIALSGVALAWLIPTQISTEVGQYDLSPSFFPSMGVWIVLTLAVLLLAVRTVELLHRSLQHKFVRAPESQAVETKAVSLRSIATEFFAWTIAGSAVFYLLPIAGFLPTAILIVMLGARVCGRRDWIPGIALGVVFCWLVQAGAWSFFTVALP